MRKILLSTAAVLTMAFVAQAQAPTSGLVAHYKFEGNLNDDSGNGYNATQVNTPSYQSSGRPGGGQAIDMNVSGGVYHDYAAHTSAFQTQDFTYSVWAKMNSFPNLYANLVENGHSSDNTVYLRFLKTSDGTTYKVEAGYYKPSGNSNMIEGGDTSQSSVIGSWHLFTVTSEVSGGDRIFNIYRDTTLVITGASSIGTTIEYSSDTKLNIGTREGNNNMTLDGLMDDVYIYNRALSAAEVHQIYNSETTGINEVNYINITTVYPNPANSTLNIEVKETASIKIVNMLGATVTTQQLNAGNNSIDVSTLTKGIYFIQSSNGGAVKFVKE